MFANAEIKKMPEIDLENKISATKELQNLSLRAEQKKTTKRNGKLKKINYFRLFC